MTPSEVKACCENCRFWDPDHRDGDFGRCRRRSPVVVPGLTETMAGDGYLEVVFQATTFPVTGYEDWCGEYAEEASDAG
jgi:hypothetical protein